MLLEREVVQPMPYSIYGLNSHIDYLDISDPRDNELGARLQIRQQGVTTMDQPNRTNSLKTTRIIFAAGFVISIMLSMGFIASEWFGGAIFTIPLIGGFLIALLASFFLKGANSNIIAWIVFIVATVLSVVLLMAGGGIAG
jgi:hypothetical protein